MAETLRYDLTETLERVLAEPRFAAPPESWWDRFLERALAELARLFAWVIDAVGGPVVAAFLALGLVGAVTLFVAVRLAGRRAAVHEERLILERLLESGEDPETFLMDAEDASRSGDHARAIRLRFIGGVLDLGRRGRIRYEPGLTTAGIAAQVNDEGFDGLSQQFDAVAYGAAAVGAAEDAWSKEAWVRMREPA